MIVTNPNFGPKLQFWKKILSLMVYTPGVIEPPRIATENQGV